eukprot:gene21048-32435_t
MLTYRYDSRTPLMIASGLGGIGVVQRILDAGAEVNDLSDENRTALMMAAAEGRAAVLKTLLNAGADVNRQDCEGWTALLHAFGRLQTVDVLLKAGANVDHVAEKMHSAPVLEAAKYGQWHVVEHFVNETHLSLKPPAMLRRDPELPTFEEVYRRTDYLLTAAHTFS